MNINSQQFEAAHVRVLGLLSFLVGWAVKPKNHREKDYGLRRLTPTYALGNMVWILLLCAFLPVTPASAHTCNLDASYYHPGGASHYVFMGTCWSNSDAQAGCREIAASVGHNPNMCHLASRSWDAGWLTGSPTSYLIHLEWSYYFIEGSSPPQAEGLSRCENTLVADPVNPSNGATVRTEGDCASLLDASYVPFARYYDSSGNSTSFLGVGWRGSYSRRVAKAALVATPRMHMVDGSPAQSALYDDPSTACTAGFIQIKSRVPNWAGATTQYVDNVCQVIKSGLVISTIAIYTPSNIPLPLPLPNVISYDLTRDDGQLIRFTVINGEITAPPGTSLKLSKTASGFTVTDGNDNVETYDTSGKLLSITSRAGVVQTMSYDVAGRLIGVVDNFGHQLTFDYDAQNRLISVTQ